MFSMVLFGLLLWCVGCATATTTFAPTPQPTVSELSVVSGGLTVEGISLEDASAWRHIFVSRRVFFFLHPGRRRRARRPGPSRRARASARASCP